MPWKDTNAMEQRIQFIADWLKKRPARVKVVVASVTQPTAEYGFAQQRW